MDINTGAGDGQSTMPRGADNIKFVRKEQTVLFCYRATSKAEARYQFGQWCNRDGALEFLEKLPRSSTGKRERKLFSSPSFTLIGASGNGIVQPLSLDRNLFERVVTVFQLPDRVRQVIGSIYGVFARFIEYDSDAQPSLLILLSTPKSPLRELFCAMRIVPDLSSVTCVLFDANLTDLTYLADFLRGSPPGLIAGQSPIAFLAMLVRECGRTSELKRHDLDENILGTEIHTMSTMWNSPEILRGRYLKSGWSNNFYEMTNALHLCHNELMFVARAVDFEADIWKFLRSITEEEQLSPWLRATAKHTEWIAVLDGIQFEITYTLDRKAQIGCLKDRIAVQIDRIDNMIAHQENTQTVVIAILALIFAPASLVASIFSAGIFPTSDSLWVAYLASTLPVTIVTILVGLKYRVIFKAWRALRT